MTLHLVELPLALRDLNLWAGPRNLGGGFDEGVALHHMLGEVFGPAMLQPFRLMVAPRAHNGTLYAYSRLDADELRAIARPVLTPAHAAVVRLDHLRSLARPVEAWVAGQRLGFDLRLRPVVRLASELVGATEDGTPVRLAKGAEVDAFLAAALRGNPAPRETIYLDWLAERLLPAATLDLAATRLASFRRLRIQRAGRRLEGPEAILHGTLNVLDPAAFAALLQRGIGRHRTYGFGMILLRPPQKARAC